MSMINLVIKLEAEGEKSWWYWKAISTGNYILEFNIKSEAMDGPRFSLCCEHHLRSIWLEEGFNPLHCYTEIFFDWVLAYFLKEKIAVEMKTHQIFIEEIGNSEKKPPKNPGTLVLFYPSSSKRKLF